MSLSSHSISSSGWVCTLHKSPPLLHPLLEKSVLYFVLKESEHLLGRLPIRAGILSSEEAVFDRDAGAVLEEERGGGIAKVRTGVHHCETGRPARCPSTGAVTRGDYHGGPSHFWPATQEDPRKHPPQSGTNPHVSSAADLDMYSPVQGCGSARPGQADNEFVVLLCMQVADICVDSLILPEAANKVVEVITAAAEPSRSIRNLFASVP